MLSTEELMIKRIKVIGNYPFNLYHKLGSIYTDNLKHTVLDENKNPIAACKWEKFPNVFEILPWWSERKVEDMPGFVKNGDDFYKVRNWIITGNGFSCQLFNNPFHYKSWTYFGFLEIINFIPATEKEYLEYQPHNKIKWV